MSQPIEEYKLMYVPMEAYNKLRDEIAEANGKLEERDRWINALLENASLKRRIADLEEYAEEERRDADKDKERRAADKEEERRVADKERGALSPPVPIPIKRSSPFSDNIKAGLCGCGLAYNHNAK